jgi:DNA polymerase-3 subunit delta'
MNAEAQNALLKTLEEPPGRTVLILVAARPHLLLPTVRSRCFALGFSALRTTELEHVLRERGMDAAEAAERAALADGRVGRAIGLDLIAVGARRDEILSCLEQLAAGGPGLGELGSMAASLAGKDEPTLIEGLELMQSLLRDAARRVLDNGGPTAAGEIAGRLERLGRRLGATRAAALVGAIDHARADLRFHVNRTLLAETVLAAVAGAPLP